jgi:DNA-binding NarL/FixJ family response regulator
MNKLSFHLTPREQEVYELVITGKCNKEIAGQLGITTRTVRFHISNIFIKTSVSNRLELICATVNAARNTSGYVSTPMEI